MGLLDNIFKVIASGNLFAATSDEELSKGWSLVAGHRESQRCDRAHGRVLLLMDRLKANR